MDKKLKALATGGVELGIQTPDGTNVLVTTNVFVSWCLDAKIALRVADAVTEGRSVGLLIIARALKDSVHNAERSEVRQLVDLREPMAYVSFKTPGPHRIFAIVVTSDSKWRNMEEHCVGKSSHDSYAFTMIGWDHDEIKSHSYLSLIGTGCVDVTIPEELFAKLPYDWDWANHFFKTKPFDECALRRRRVLAYTLQPIWFAFIWLCSFVLVLVLSLLLFRGIDLRPIRNPFRYPLPMIYAELRSTPLFIEYKGVPLLPVLLCSPFALTCSLAVWYFFGVHVLVLLAIMLPSIAVLATAAIAFEQHYDWTSFNASQKKRAAQRLKKELDSLICETTGPKRPDVEKLSWSLKNVKFIALRTKQNVCKSFPT